MSYGKTPKQGALVESDGGGKRNFNPSDKQQGVQTGADRLTLLEGEQYILIDEPAPFVRRITLNRPEKRNALRQDPYAKLTPTPSF